MARPTFDTTALPPLPRIDAGDEDQDFEILEEASGSGDEDNVEPELIDNGDGTVTLLDKEAPAEPERDLGEFYGNLVDVLDEHKLKQFCTALLEKIEVDKEARKRRDDQYEEGLRRTGLGKDAPGGAEFEGASKMVHPLLAEGAIDYAARTLKEIAPPAGPVKPAPYSDDETPEAEKEHALKRAARKAKFMNWQLMKQCVEFIPELERVLTQEPMAGDCFLLFWWEKRLRCEFVPVDRAYLPYEASGWDTAERRTLLLTLPEEVYQRRVAAGLYAELPTLPGPDDDQTKSQKAQDKIEGKDNPGMESEGVRRLYRVEMTVDFEGGDPEAEGEAPYILIIEEESGTPVRVERNWRQEDEQMDSLKWVAPFSFIPWAGAYSIGFPQLIGGLSGALTGAIRALLDSAHINNAATLAKKKSAKTPGQNQRIVVGQVNEIDVGVTEDIRASLMAVPFNPPSPVLYQLFTDLDKLGRGVVRTALDDVAEQNANVPVGTQMSRVEQALVVFSTIHARQHRSMGRVLEIVHQLNSFFLKSEEVIQDLGALVVKRQDFEGPCDVGPVSDPAVFSEQQRLAQAQAVVSRADLPQNATLYNRLKVEKRLLKLLKVPDPEELLVTDPEPEELDPVRENVKAMQGKPIKVYADQEHQMHLSLHAAFLQPLLGTPMFAMPAAAGLVAHMKEHIAYLYQQQMGEKLAKIGYMAEALGLQAPDAKEVILEAAKAQMAEFQTDLAAVSPVLEAAMGVIQKMTPPNPANEANAAQMMQAQATMAMVDVEKKKAANDEIKIKLEAENKKVQADLDMRQRALEEGREAHNAQIAEQAQALAEAQLRFENHSTQVDQAIRAVEVAVKAESESMKAAAGEAQSANQQVLEEIKALAGGIMSKNPETPPARRVSVRRGADGSLEGLEVDRGEKKLAFRVTRDPEGNVLGLEPHIEEAAE